jgi:hypothetical protein
MRNGNLKISGADAITAIAVDFNWAIISFDWSAIEWITKSDNTLKDMKN